MDALFILNNKNNDILFFKEFNENENNIKLRTFLSEKDNLFLDEKSPYMKIQNTILIHFISDSILYISLISEDTLTNSIYQTLETINQTLLQAFDNCITVDLIRDNFVEISIMIDNFLLNGVPTINEVNALSCLVTPYNLKDKLTEKFIGKAKEYERKTLNNYIRDTQTSYENYKYLNENNNIINEVLFHFNDYLEMTCDKNFNQLNKTLHSEIEIFSKIAHNIDMNLLLNIPFNMLNFSVAEGVTTKKKDILMKKNVDCTIKHGNYVLMNMMPNLTTSVSLPFKLSINSNLTNNIYSLSVQIDLEAVRDVCYPLDDVELTIYFPDKFTNQNLSVNLGELDISNRNYAKWIIGRLEKVNPCVLKGNLNVEGNSQSNCVLSMSCKIDKFSISGGSIVKGTITKNPKNLEISKKGRNFTIIKSLEIVF